MLFPREAQGRQVHEAVALVPAAERLHFEEDKVAMETNLPGSIRLYRYRYSLL